MNENKSNKYSLTEWLGFTANPDFSRAKPLGILLGFALTILAFILLITAIAILIQFLLAGLRAGPYTEDVEGNAIRNSGLALAALLGVPFVVWRSIIAAKQVQIADESLFNDKINAAAKDLAARHEVTRVIEHDNTEIILKEWKDDLVTRAAAIDRLEGLSSERKEVAPRIIRLLATYVRGNFPRKDLIITEPPFSRKLPRMDLQKAIDTIGRVHELAVKADTSQWRMDLKGCDFDGVNFQGGFFWATDFSDCRFELSGFMDANLEGCLFRESLLNYADFRRSNLIGARFDRVILNRPIPVTGGFVSSINLGTLRGATFIAADISALDYLGTPDCISETFATKDTVISHVVREEMLEMKLHARTHALRYMKGRRSLSDNDMQDIKLLEETGFQHWSPNDSSDGATGYLLETFYEELKMKKWPYY